MKHHNSNWIRNITQKLITTNWSSNSNDDSVANHYLLLWKMWLGLVAANPEEAFKRGAQQKGFSKALKLLLLSAVMKWNPRLQAAIATAIFLFKKKNTLSSIKVMTSEEIEIKWEEGVLRKRKKLQFWREG